MQKFKNENLSAGAEDVVLAKDETLQKTRSRSLALAQFAVLLSVAIFAPALNIQAATGTLVNATLFISAVLLGVPAAVLIGIIPSVISSVTGLLPAAILPMVPFIIFSNVILVVVFAKARNKSFLGGVAVASILKFAFLSIISSFVIHFFVAEKVAAKIALMMSWPQLFTALSGGILAYFVLSFMNKLDK